jgi:hypothetical protein
VENLLGIARRQMHGGPWPRQPIRPPPPAEASRSRPCVPVETGALDRAPIIRRFRGTELR